MDITQLENSISALFRTKGYAPLIESEQGLEGAIHTFPTAWIQLPKVLYVEGRDQGVICHKVIVNLLDNYGDKSFEEKRLRLDDMHRDALEVMAQLSKAEGVVEIEDLTLTPRVTHLTRFGDVAQVCSASVVSYF
ncbi:MAG: hypothetical protein SNH94_04420 [Rikenellaceae bacterium]